MPEKQYRLICMAFDGDYVTDSIGSMEDCENKSSNMGSNWYFYPWHIITTIEGKIIVKMFGGIIDNELNPLMGIKFNGRKIDTVKTIFKECCDKIEEGKELNIYEFEEIILEYQDKYERRKQIELEKRVGIE